MPLRDLLASRVPLRPVVVDNDGNCAAIGETWVGAAVGCRHVVCLTLGTGVGGGLVLDGRVYRGAHGVGAEVGHLVVAADGEPCSCGGRGCLEAYASGTAVARMARSRLTNDTATASTLRELGSNVLRAEDVTEAAAAGDTLAREILAEAGRMLGCGLTSLVHLLEPELVIVSGGLAEAGDLILAPARAELRRRAFPASVRHVKVLPAKLGNDAGLVGAAALVLAKPERP
jgi:glucokinase